NAQFMISFFFLLSRSGHTRFSRDWSADVCSSDLPHAGQRRGVAGQSAGAGGVSGCLSPVMDPSLGASSTSSTKAIPGSTLVELVDRKSVGRERMSVRVGSVPL